MPLSFRQAGNLFIAGPNINIYPSGNTYAISGAAGGGGGSGTAVTGLTSAGTGNILVFSSVTNNNTVLVQKSLSAGTGVAIIDNGNGTLTFSATSAGGSGTIISGTNVGTGVGVFSGVAGSNLVFRTIKAGSNATAYLSGNDLIISATTGGLNGVTAITNTGGSARVLSSITNNTLFARTISGSNGIEALESGDVILVRPSGLTANEIVIAGTGGILSTSDFFQVDSTNGTMSIGFNTPTPNTSTRLLIEAGSSTISQIRLTKFATNVALPNDGDIWYNSTGSTLKFYKNTGFTDFIFRDNNYALTGVSDFRILEADSTGTLSSTRNLISFGVFNAISSVTISNTTISSSTISNSIIGSQTLFSSTDSKNAQLIAGKKFRFNARGTIQTTATTAGAFNVNFRLGNTVIASSATFTLQTGISANSYFEIDTTFTIKTQGTGGTVNGSGKMLTDYTNLESGGSQIKAINSLGDVTLDTTQSRLFDCHVTFTTASTNNKVIINESTLEYLN
jgi:hypothetical protein